MRPTLISGFCCMKQPGGIDGMLVDHRVTPPPSLIKFPSTHLDTRVERGTARVKCLVQKHNTTQCPLPRLEPTLLDLESSTLITMRPPCTHSLRNTLNNQWLALPLVPLQLLWIFSCKETTTVSKHIKHKQYFFHIKTLKIIAA